MTPSMTLLLQARNLNAWYGAAHILFDVSLQVNRGEVVAPLRPISATAPASRRP